MEGRGSHRLPLPQKCYATADHPQRGGWAADADIWQPPQPMISNLLPPLSFFLPHSRSCLLHNLANLGKIASLGHVRGL